MKIKKVISKSLILSMLITNISYSSNVLANDNSRYEIIKDNDIQIDNVIRESSVDIEIEGNTLVNLAPQSWAILDTVTGHGDFDFANKVYRAKTDGTYSHFAFMGSSLDILNPGQEYTLIFKTKRQGSELKKSVQLLDVVNYDYYSTRREISITEGTKYHKVLIDVNENFSTSSRGNETQLRITLNDITDGHLEISEVMLLPGNWTDREIPKYFEGIKSVGEVEPLIIKSQNKNILPLNEYKKDNYILKGIQVSKEEKGLRLNGTMNFNELNDLNVHFYPYNYKFYLYPGKMYKLKFNLLEGEFITPENSPNYNYCYRYESPEGKVSWNSIAEYPIIDCRNNKGVATIDNIRIYSYKTREVTFNNALYQVQLEEITEDDINSEFEYTESKSNEIQIPLKEPLRGLPNGKKDRIIKRNGEWVIERNLMQITLDGSPDEKWKSTKFNYNTPIYSWDKTAINIQYLDSYKTILSDKFIYQKQYSQTLYNNKAIYVYNEESYSDQAIRIQYPCDTLEEFIDMLSKNPVTAVIQLNEPIYEKLEVSPTLSTYLDRTYIKTNSNIKPTLKVVYDRAYNKAVDATGLAKVNPTSENIALARMWTNLLEESTFKDELQDEISNITNIEDIKIDKLTTSANMDLYIKSENTLSMSLNTNSIVFDNYSSVNDLEKLNAVNITINSSLPYSLNASLESSIKSIDDNTVIEPNILSLRESGATYQVFSSVKDNLVLQENVDAGNGNQHDIDIKLSKNTVDKANIYKATIKFEAVQK